MWPGLVLRAYDTEGFHALAHTVHALGLLPYLAPRRTLVRGVISGRSHVRQKIGWSRSQTFLADMYDRRVSNRRVHVELSIVDRGEKKEKRFRRGVEHPS